MKHFALSSCKIALLAFGACTLLSAQTADESSNANYRLRSRTRSAVMELTVGTNHGLSGTIGEPFPGTATGDDGILQQTDVFEPSTVQVVLWLEEGWNLVGLPFDHAGTVDGLFVDEYGPLSNGVAFAWVADTLRYLQLVSGFLAGEGFWVVLSADASIVLRGTRVSLRNAPLQYGWNLLGRTWDGEDLEGGVYWNGGDYVSADTMTHGVGYWYFVPRD